MLSWTRWEGYFVNEGLSMDMRSMIKEALLVLVAYASEVGRHCHTRGLYE